VGGEGAGREVYVRDRKGGKVKLKKKGDDYTLTLSSIGKKK